MLSARYPRVSLDTYDDRVEKEQEQEQEQEKEAAFVCFPTFSLGHEKDKWKVKELESPFFSCQSCFSRKNAPGFRIQFPFWSPSGTLEFSEEVKRWKAIAKEVKGGRVDRFQCPLSRITWCFCCS